ncbi:hypothetical protein CON37_26850 [Bacillus cereus]|nr:hypothetical protein CON37_26850 [Bacillus cereus]
MEEFGHSRKSWFQKSLELPCGIPSHDTFNRVFTLLCPKAFEESFRSWTAEIYKLIQGQVIAIDGKGIRGSKVPIQSLRPLNIVRAWATENQFVIPPLSREHKRSKNSENPLL